ncbi:TIGR04104 family putative zinc finger protein [Shouchella shacheensis]|uniref:TIGR04104 family putative zinc finger protein n=1 Tax=Shouchella shacheensis TaxID=1649580 RepID=UPI0007405038|nr:TIGR04104 family putative zinc finger protein [Shouchella shacheensis]
MPTCEHCGYTWTWKESLKKLFTFRPEMVCPSCEEKQYQTQRSKMKSSFLMIVVLLPLLMTTFFDISVALLLGLSPILLVFSMSISPFLMEVSSKEEFIDFFRK